MRDDFSEKNKRILGERAAYICSKPDCRRPTIGPHSIADKSLKTGKASHICAAAPGGPRYDSNQTPEQRSSIQNGIWLCAECATVIDTDSSPFPATELLEWKRQHEDWLRAGGIVPALPEILFKTLPGIAVPDEPGTIEGNDAAEWRDHQLVLGNPSATTLTMIHLDVWLPEPIIKKGHRSPVGVESRYVPNRLPLRANVAPGGSVTRLGPPMPEDSFVLQIDRLPAGHFIDIGLRTSLKPYRDHDVDYDTGMWAGVFTGYTTRTFIDGQFQFEYRGATLTRHFFVPLSYDKTTRHISIVEIRDDYGPWKRITGGMGSGGFELRIGKPS